MSGKKKQYSKEKLNEAVEEVKAGASLRETAKKFGIPHTTLQDYKKNKYVHNPHPNSALTPGEEEVLLSFIFWMADHGFPVTRSLVKALAVGIIKESGRSETTTVNLEKGPSDVWWSRFKARHPELASRTADSLDRARVHGATPEAIEAFFRLHEALYEKHNLEYKPHLIYNCDETGFGDKPRSREKVLCQTGRKHVYQQQQTTREHITVHCCVNAAGDSIPPFIIYPGCLPSNAYRLDGPPNALYVIQEKGYMDSELFLKWLHHFIRYAPEERPLILIMDQHETHVSKEVIMFCREKNIEILCLPAHTTHILQPLDIAVFNPLKTAFSTMASRMGLVRGDIVVGKKQFSALLKHVYPTAVTAQNIKAGFRKAGIFPLSRAAVDTTKVVRVLPSVDGSDATQSSPAATPSITPSIAPTVPSIAPTTPSITSPTDISVITQTPCPTCNINKVGHKNYLVAAGVIPESLANVLMSPALERKEKVRRRIPLPARVITSDEYFDLLVEKETEEKDKEEKKRKRKEEMAKKKEEKKTSPGGQKAKKSGTSSY
ncbi:tigger transposable element-derived protein 6-like [Cyprinus carpio]|uniref:Tigger transposable element-derived protein 6-like n=1 Tax=Cyprinus carpio TaxID=7962 RepID=A0A9Q9ZYJ9_CYPCA|nr:tigger transposable element-derived protein 6-like [Cyprinus carpio]